MEDTGNTPKHDPVSNKHEDIQERASPGGNLQRPLSVASQPSLPVESEASSVLTKIARAGPAFSKKRYVNTKTKSKTWKASYQKIYVCRLCDKHCKSRGNINVHIKKHRSLIHNNRSIFTKFCTINLKKLDSKPNLTGIKETVVLNPDKIVCHEGRMHYYVLYTLNEECKETEVEVQSDSSDDFAPRTQGKRRRVLSKSSTDTVILNDDHEKKAEAVIDNDKKEIPNVMECIDLDDSSDDSVHDDTMATSTSNINTEITTGNNHPLPELTDHKTISKLVSACQTKYLKKIEFSEEQEKQFESDKSKLLNIGFKAIFQQGFKSTGILRYLEHEHLEIKWKPINTALRTHSKESKCVRIMPRVKGKEDFNQDDGQWKKITNHNFIFIKEEAQPIQIQKRNSSPVKESSVMNNTSTISVVNGHSKPDPSLSDCAVLYSKTTIDSDQKLLNASPVANPKQLPKKAVTFEIKPSPAPVFTEPIVVPFPVVQDQSFSNFQPMTIDVDNFTNEDHGNDNMCMPIITSTTSLAPGITNYTIDDTAEREKTNATSNSDSVTKSDGPVETPSNKPAVTVTLAPRIKVKNVADLMTERALSQQNTISTQPSIWLVPRENTVHQITQASVNNGSSNGVPTVNPTTSDVISSLNSGEREYVILDTVEMPNAKTSSPFKYLQSLMHMHNICVLNGSQQLPNDFICLIKFKLQFDQQSIHKPVVLCLSLHCSENNFFLGVKDPGHPSYIDLNKLSANWQWEILKIYTARQHVVNKLYQNAKKISPTVLGYVKIFISILQTIQLKTSF